MSGALSFAIGHSRTEVRFVPSIDPETLAREIGAEALAVYDATTRRLFGPGAGRPSGQAPGAGFRGSVVLAAGERAKRWRSVAAILARAAGLAMGRDGWVVGIGGGVVCDVAAFAASMYMRGCSLALVPTTLLAMVDASLGGKTGIDFEGWKNLVGTFYPASLLLVCVGSLESLPAREYRSGLAEALKTAIIGDPGLLDLLEARREAVLARDGGLLEEIVRRCLAVKGAIVQSDPREQGGRAVLNLGHTFGHALESAMGLGKWTHGEAVAWGTVQAAALGRLLGLTDEPFAVRIRALFAAYGFPLEARARRDRMAAALARDKKRRAGRLRFAIPRRAGEVTIEEVEEEAVRGLLAHGGMA